MSEKLFLRVTERCDHFAEWHGQSLTQILAVGATFGCE
jgi:hypothetical protein